MLLLWFVIGHSHRKNPYYLTEKDIKTAGGRIAPDEVFKPIPNETGFYISNYARIISKNCGDPRFMQPWFQRGYYVIKLYSNKHGKEEYHAYMIHRLVAMNFIEIPKWIREGDEIEVHHIIKVISDSLFNDHSYKNLMWVPRSLHAAFDALKGMWVRVNGKWVAKDYVTAAEHYGISPYDLVEAVGNKQKKPCTRREGKYEIYEQIINVNGKPVELNLKIYR